MSEIGEMYRDIKDEVRVRKAVTYEENLEVLFLSEFNFPRAFEIKEESKTVLFREKKKPAVNFFPSTSRWVLNNKVRYGNAEAFLNWYRKQ